MVNYVYGQDEIVAGFTANLIPSVRERGFGRCQAIGVIDDEGKLIAGFVYHNYDPDAGVIQISGAALPGTHWCTQKTLAHIYRYPFLLLGCQMITQLVPADNERLLRQLAALNYSFVKVPRLLGRDADAVVGLLTYEAWVDSKICKRFKHHLVFDQLEEAA